MVSFVNSISKFVYYSMPYQSLQKDISGTIQPRANTFGKFELTHYGLTPTRYLLSTKTPWLELRVTCRVFANG